MVQYIGVKSTEEAKQMNETFMTKANDHNKHVTARRNLLALIGFALVIGVSMATYYFLDPVKQMWQAAAAVFGVLAFLVEFFVFSKWGKDVVGVEDSDKPVGYQFFKATDGRELLDSEVVQGKRIDRADLRLTVKTESGDTATEWIRNLKLVVRPDAKNVVVDLNGGTIYTPQT